MEILEKYSISRERAQVIGNALEKMQDFPCSLTIREAHRLVCHECNIVSENERNFMLEVVIQSYSRLN